MSGATVSGNDFADNVGSVAGTFGLGGGLFAADAGGLQIAENTFHGNAAATSPILGESSIGGAIYAVAADDLGVTNNQFNGNLASLYGAGLGGAIYLYSLQDANIAGNTVAGNWAVVYDYFLARAGGIGLGDVQGITFTDNFITDNVGGFNPAGFFVTAAGGGVFAARVEDMLMARNVISGNVGAMAIAVNHDARGGGLCVDTSHSGPSQHWTLTDNVIEGNTMLATGAESATGGGARLTIVGSQVHDNRIVGNQACRGCYDDGEAYDEAVDGLLIEGALESSVVSSAAADVTANLILASPAGQERRPGFGIRFGATDGFTLTNNVIAGFDSGLIAVGGYMLPKIVLGKRDQQHLCQPRHGCLYRLLAGLADPTLQQHRCEPLCGYHGWPGGTGDTGLHIAGRQ